MFSDLITKYGTFAGLGLIVLFLGAYFVSPEIMLSQGLYWVSMLITLAAMTMAGIEDRKIKFAAIERDMGGTIPVNSYPFKTALRVAFGVFALSSLIYHVFDLTMFMVVNPDLSEMQLNATLNSIEQLAPYFGEEWAEQTTEMLEENPPYPSLSNSFFDYTFGLLGGFVLSAIIALIVKR